MTASLTHRGPDDSGVWVDQPAGVGLGHRRLSIIDLSPSGHQPMISANGRYVLTYNGEIYNHSELRKELDSTGFTPPGGWRGHSDTETLLEAIAAWGLTQALAASVGMFAFALWDKRERKVFLARDRFGEKPLYYGWVAGDFLFASELKSIRAHPRFDLVIEPRALDAYAARMYIPAPLSIYRRIFKLEPGCVLTVSKDALKSPLDDAPSEGSSLPGLTFFRYWSYAEVMRRGLEAPIQDEIEAREQLENALVAAIRGQSIADVPIGAFLSGGIDSSTVVALYQKHSTRAVRSFSIGFDEAGFNEAEYAKAVAAHLGTIHSEHYVTVREAQDVIPLLPSIYDEPFADSSQIPTFLVSRFARGEVKVALSGDAGDELFGGYTRHVAAPRMWHHIKKVPIGLRALGGRPLSKLPSRMWAQTARLMGKRGDHWGAVIQKAFRVAAHARSFDDICRSYLDEWAFEGSPLRLTPKSPSHFPLQFGVEAPETLRLMYCDAVTYLPDDILCKVDRAAMAVSLETRVPFLDHRVAELSARIPLSMKVRGARGKCILRDLLYEQAPAALFERPKAGFAIPVGEWLKGPLRPWAEELLEPRRMAQQGWFNPTKVEKRWAMHLSGQRDSTPAIWAILMFEAWLRQQSEREREAA